MTQTLSETPLIGKVFAKASICALLLKLGDEVEPVVGNEDFFAACLSD
jgi:hypothetical protein